MAYSPQGRKESDTTERLHFSVSDYARCWELDEENNEILSHEISE